MYLLASLYLYFAIVSQHLISLLPSTGNIFGGRKFCKWLAKKCLRITKLTVPSKASIGEIVWLNCSYDLESDSLYSIKWYKESEEMYRFVPSNSPPIMTYDVSGLKCIMPSEFQSSTTVTSSAAGGCIRVAILTSEATAQFRCEVSAEAPSFQTSKRSSQLTVTSSAAGGEGRKVGKEEEKKVDQVTGQVNSSNDLVSDHAGEYHSRDNDHFHTREEAEMKSKKHFVDGAVSESPVKSTRATLLESVNQIFTGLSCCFKLIMGMSLVVTVASVIFLLIRMYPCIDCYCFKSTRRRSSSLGDIATSTASPAITSASHSLLQSTQFK